MGSLTLLLSERPKLNIILAFLSAIGLKFHPVFWLNFVTLLRQVKNNILELISGKRTSDGE